ncbi:MAG TPA: DUF2892 domain-containing protein [Chloroflexi bacterium]|nr:DUF2892 domain-containing protein [Chloroflexota bacterium]
MKRNIGELDRLLRTILGVYGMLLGFLFIQGVAGTVLGVLSLVVLITGLIGHCAVYTLLDISTADTEQPLEESASEQKSA